MYIELERRQLIIMNNQVGVEEWMEVQIKSKWQYFDHYWSWEMAAWGFIESLHFLCIDLNSSQIVKNSEIREDFILHIELASCSKENCLFWPEFYFICY